MTIEKVSVISVSVAFNPQLVHCHVLQSKSEHQARNLLLTLRPRQRQHPTEPPLTLLTMTDPGTTMAAPAFSLHKDDLVILYVGPEEKEFAVHEIHHP